MLADLHLHTSASDGTLSPSELVRRYFDLGCEIMAITDHDTVDGIKEGESEAKALGAVLIPGVEFSCTDGGVDCHLLGLGVDYHSSAITHCLSQSRALRMEKLEDRLIYLHSRFGITLLDSDVAALRSMDSAGRLHMAQAIVRAGYSPTVDSALHAYLLGKDLPERAMAAEECVSAVLLSGGVPVLAHPLGGEGEGRCSLEDAEKLIRRLMGYGLAGMECYYSRYEYSVSLGLCALASRLGLLVSGGSDYHGANKTVKPMQLSADGFMPDSMALSVLSAEPLSRLCPTTKKTIFRAKI